MATVSFAVGSVTAAVVWGTFFYPPPPVATTRAAVSVDVRSAPAAAAPAMPTHGAVAQTMPSTLALAGHSRLAVKP